MHCFAHARWRHLELVWDKTRSMEQSPMTRKTVPVLKKFLRDRGVSVDSYRKNDLVALADAASRRNIPLERENYDRNVELKKRRTVDGKELPDPATIKDWKKDLKMLPGIELPQAVVFLLGHGWSNSMVNDYKKTDGYHLYMDHHIDKVEMCEPSCGFTYVRATCVRETQQSEDYHVWLLLKEIVPVSSSCGCPADDQACKHVAALLFSLWSFNDRHRDRHTEVGTDVPCAWDRPRKESIPLPLDDIDIRRNKEKDLVKPTVDDYKPIYSATPQNLERLWKNAALAGSLACNYLSGEESSEDETLPSFVETCKAHGQNGWEKVKKLFTSSLCSKIEEETRGQSDNPIWLEQRQGRITASLAHRVLRCKRGHQGLVDLILGHHVFQGNVHTEYGKMYEGVARSLFKTHFVKEHRRAKLWETGLIVNPATPHLGASPDAMVFCACHGTGVVEIKCPTTGKDKGLTEYAATSDNVQTDENDNLELLPGAWHTQVQMQLAITNASYCEFVLYLGQKPYLHRQKIFFNQQQWSADEEKLTSFFLQNVLPAIVQ